MTDTNQKSTEEAPQSSPPTVSPKLPRVLRALASLDFTVVLFALSIVLVFVGTLAQVDLGIWTVVDQYFRTFVAWVEFKIFFPKVSGGFPFPGGWTLGTLLLVNLVAAHAVRFKVVAKGQRRFVGSLILLVGIGLTLAVTAGIFQKEVAATEDAAFWRVLWRLGNGTFAGLVLLVACRMLFRERAGIVLLHGGIVLMLLGELITGLFAVESTMTIADGETVRFVDHSLKTEFAIIDESDATADKVTVVPGSMLSTGATVKDDRLPFDLRVVEYMPNSTLPRPITEEERATNRALVGTGREVILDSIPEGSGVDSNARRDAPSAYIEILDKNGSKSYGTHLFSLWFDPNFTMRRWDFPQYVNVDGKRYTLYLRSERRYLRSDENGEPFALRLLEFRHDKYLGTDKASNFSSKLRLTDKDRDIDRTIRIWMNNPLRYAGRTFYQSSCLADEEGTVRQVG
ncbi:MAG: cytochrome c biogenesis protein ResB, partial [Planctomycetota bacterium]